MILLSIPALFALFMLLVILLEGYSFTTRPMARGLSKSELRRRYRRELRVTTKLRALTEELRNL